eukprot:CCRYP_006351-RA/>CCRYP_006351-RA protein AED:0.42 eAED:0.15 QI:0/0/0/0.6/1/1/5/0/704
MSSPNANEATVYEAVRAVVTPLPLVKIVGQPTTSTVNHLRQQIAKLAAAVKTTSWGGRHGHLALVLTDAEYRTVTGNPDIDCQRFFDSGSRSSNNPPRVPPNITSSFSTANQHSLLEYTNRLEGALETATEHAAAITLDNTTLLQKLEAQQKDILEQQAKFMALLLPTNRAPLSPPTVPRNQHNRSNGMTPTEGHRIPRFCNLCKKDSVYHVDANKRNSSAPQPSLCSLNYWSPLASPETKVRFNLPPQYHDKDSTAWRHRITGSISPWFHPTTKRNRHHHTTSMTKLQVKHGIADGTIPSAISETCATSTAGALHDPFHSTTAPSTKVFLLPTGGTAHTTHISQLLLNIRAPANQVDIVPNLTQSLLSGSKFADAGYMAIYDKDEVNFYNSDKIHINATSILQGYRCPHTGLWRVPLRQITSNVNNDTLILDLLCGTKSLNTKYAMPATVAVRNHLKSSGEREEHTILNVFELPSIKQTIRYFHAAAGFPTKTTWMAAIRRGNYNTWPLVTIATYTSTFLSRKKLKKLSRGACVASAKVTYTSRPMTPVTQSTPTKRRIRLTVGNNRINFPGNCGTPTADMITVKILLNSVISTVNAKFMTIDIKDFYLNMPMERPEYMRLKLSNIPSNIIEPTISVRLHTMDMSLCASEKVCMDSHKPASLRSNSSKNTSKPTDTTKAKSTPVSGHIIGDPSALPSVLMTSV